MKTEAGSNVFVFSHLASLAQALSYNNSFLINKHTQVFIPAATLWAVRLDPKRSLTASSSKSQRGVRDLREMGNSGGKVIKVGREAK
jgi:hypothetical protein